MSECGNRTDDRIELGAIVSGTARDALRAIAELLAPDSAVVIDRVTLAIDQPERYVEVQNELYSQTLEKPHPEMAWFALVDALHEQERLVWVDWNEDAAEVLGQLRVLTSAPAGSWEWADSLAMGFDRAAGLESLLARIVDNITDTGVSLAWLDSDSDTFLLALVPSVHGATLVELALATGHCVRVSRVSAFAEQAAQSFDSIAQSGWRALGIHQCIFSEHVVFAVDCVPVEFAQTASVGGRESANRRQQ